MTEKTGAWIPPSREEIMSMSDADFQRARFALSVAGNTQRAQAREQRALDERARRMGIEPTLKLRVKT